MRPKHYVVELTPDKRQDLTELVSAGHGSARTLTRARILLKADQAPGGPAWGDGRIADALGCSRRTVERVRQPLVEAGLAAAITHKKTIRPGRQPVMDVAVEARLMALACSDPPDGRARWTLRLLDDRLVQLQVVKGVSHETVRQAIKKRRSGGTCGNHG